jgi:anti-sigma regulatory factor (Ser/Thr protein kinase)
VVRSGHSPLADQDAAGGRSAQPESGGVGGGNLPRVGPGDVEGRDWPVGERLTGNWPHRPVEPSQPGLADVEHLAETVSFSGLRLDVRYLGVPRTVPADLDLSAYRIVQEAVTNVLRHAHARLCVVTIGAEEGELSIEVVDDGRGGAFVPGFGLTGMRERAELLHGRFSAGPRDGGGFRVAATIPLPL